MWLHQALVSAPAHSPGQKGVIKINFNPATFKGEFRRSVKVQFSNSRKRTVLKFNGVVIPK